MLPDDKFLGEIFVQFVGAKFTKFQLSHENFVRRFFYLTNFDKVRKSGHENPAEIEIKGLSFIFENTFFTIFLLSLSMFYDF